MSHSLEGDVAPPGSLHPLPMIAIGSGVDFSSLIVKFGADTVVC